MLVLDYYLPSTFNDENTVYTLIALQWQQEKTQYEFPVYNFILPSSILTKGSASTMSTGLPIKNYDMKLFLTVFIWNSKLKLKF